MINTVTTKIARIKMLSARKDGTALAQITHMAFGTGGHAAGDTTTPIAPTEDDLALETEVIRVNVILGAQPTDTTLVYIGEITENSTADDMTITEAAIFDADGDMIARKTFGGKYKDPADVFSLDWNEEF